MSRVKYVPIIPHKRKQTKLRRKHSITKLCCVCFPWTKAMFAITKYVQAFIISTHCNLKENNKKHPSYSNMEFFIYP